MTSASLIPTFFTHDFFMGSYFGPAFTFLAVTGEVIRLSEHVVAVICWVEEVYVADEHLEMQITHKHTHSTWEY